jgi:hypothetical protein
VTTDRPTLTPAWRRLKGWQWALAVIGVAALIAMAIGRADHQRPGSDFAAFWRAGYDFAHGAPLYVAREGDRDFLYPPFAGQLFQIFGVLPLKVAAGLFYLVSVGLWVAAARLTWDIVRSLQPDPPASRRRFIVALVLSAQFVLNNLNLLQINLVIFVLCLLGVRGILRGRPLAAGWIAVAAWIKITPVFLALWAIVRGGRRAVLAIGAVGTLCVILPMLQRGPSQGLADLTAYYEAFLSRFVHGGVITLYTNQNLAALVYRAVVPGHPDEQYQYAYLPALEPYAALLYRVLAGAVIVAFLARLAYLQWHRRPVTSLELASVFLTSHLVSGITWKAHLVSLLFVFYAILSIRRERLDRTERILVGIGWVGMAIIGLIGRDLFGNTIHHYMGGLSIFAWVMLYLWALSIGLVQTRRDARSMAEGAQPLAGAGPPASFT